MLPLTHDTAPECIAAGLDHTLQRARLLGQGSSAQVYEAGPGEVIKLFRPGVSPSMVDREFAAAALAAAQGVRVAAPLERATHDGRELIRYRLVPGHTLLSAIARKPHLGLPTMHRLARLHASIHRRISGSSLRTQGQVLQRDIQQAPTDDRTRSAAAACLAVLEPGSHLCHGDLHPGNVIDAPEGLTAIDWSKACIGHPAADVARTELLLRFGAVHDALERVSFVQLGRSLAAGCYVRSYLLHGGMTRADVLAWHLPVAVAWLRFRQGRPGDAFERYVAKLVARTVRA